MCNTVQYCIAQAGAWHANINIHAVLGMSRCAESPYSRQTHHYCILSRSLCSLASKPFASKRCRLLCRASREPAPGDTHTFHVETTCYMQLASHPLMSLYIFWPALKCNPSLIKYAIMQASHTGMRE